MSKPITPEMIAAWRTLQGFAVRNRHAISMIGVNAAEAVAKAIDVLDNSGFMVPIEDAGLCTYQVGGGHHSPPEYCEAEIDGVTEYCPKHQALADLPDPGEEPRTTFEYTAENRTPHGVIVTVHDVDGRGTSVCEDGHDTGEALRNARLAMVAMGMVAPDQPILFTERNTTS